MADDLVTLPMKQPLHCCHIRKPTRLVPVRLFFANGNHAEGEWTGEEWQVDRQTVTPISWQMHADAEACLVED